MTITETHRDILERCVAHPQCPARLKATLLDLSGSQIKDRLTTAMTLTKIRGLLRALDDAELDLEAQFA